MAHEKILFVDDEVDFVDIVRTRLEEAGYRVVPAYDGEAALEKVRTDRPDVIILDIMMPKINGFDVCRKLKTDNNYKDIPIMILTARFQPSDIKFSKEVGADAYITKPFEPHMLLEKLHELLEKSGGPV